MKNGTTLLAAALLMLELCTGRAEETPRAPATATEAAAAGLKRIDASELGQRYGGARLLITDKGQVIRLDLHPDGTLNYLDDNGRADTGSWLVQTRNGGTVCRRYSKQMGGRSCVVYFAAPDDVHWFGYGADDGRWRDTTRPVAVQ